MSTLTEYLRDTLQGKIKGGIKPSLNQKEVSLNQISSGTRTRIFASNSSGEVSFTGFLENSAAKSFMSNLKELINSKKISIPMNEASVKIIMDEFNKMSNDVLQDNEFNSFLDNHFKEHNITEQAVKDQIKNELVRAYRFQVLTSAAKALYKSTEGLSATKRELIAQENHYAKCVNAFMQQCNIDYLSYKGNVSEFIERMENYYTNNITPPNLGLLVDVKDMFDRITQGNGGTLSTNDIMIRRIAAQVLGPQKSIDVILKNFNTLKIDDQQQIIKFFNNNKSGNTSTPEAKQLFNALNAQFLKNAPELAESSVKHNESIESNVKTGVNETTQKKKTFFDTVVAGARAAWNAVQNLGAKLTTPITPSIVEGGDTKATEGDVTLSGNKKQSGWSRFVNLVNSFLGRGSEQIVIKKVDFVGVVDPIVNNKSEELDGIRGSIREAINNNNKDQYETILKKLHEFTIDLAYNPDYQNKPEFQKILKEASLIRSQFELVSVTVTGTKPKEVSEPMNVRKMNFQFTAMAGIKDTSTDNTRAIYESLEKSCNAISEKINSIKYSKSNVDEITRMISELHNNLKALENRINLGNEKLDVDKQIYLDSIKHLYQKAANQLLLLRNFAVQEKKKSKFEKFRENVSEKIEKKTKSLDETLSLLKSKMEKNKEVGKPNDVTMQVDNPTMDTPRQSSELSRRKF